VPADLVDRRVAAFQSALRFLNPEMLHISDGGEPRCRPETTLETSFREARPPHHQTKKGTDLFFAQWVRSGRTRLTSRNERNQERGQWCLSPSSVCMYGVSETHNRGCQCGETTPGKSFPGWSRCRCDTLSAICLIGAGFEIGCNATMIIQNTGKIGHDFYVVGSASVPVYLLAGPVPILFDAGLTAGAFLYEAGIRQVLGERTPEYLFLTHSHFDHVGSASYFKEVWPDLKVGGSMRCSEILQKPKAVQLLRDLNVEGTRMVKDSGLEPVNEERFESFQLDIIVQPEQTIELAPGLSVVVLNTPGHTRDFMSYYLPEKEILVASEAVATYEADGYLQPEFLVDFDAYLESLSVLQKLGVKILCPGHHVVLTDEDAVAHIGNSLQAARDYLSMAEKFLVQENGDIDKVVELVKKTEWDPRPWPKQPESAYLLNTWNRVNTIWKRIGKS
jgi:2-aminobenzoylacetyl-CoA thioesterase